MTEHSFWKKASVENPLYYIATSRVDWSDEEFLRDGFWRVAKWVMPWIEKQQLSPSMFLEIGCGAGRLAYHISPFVKQYVGVDIAIQHLHLAQKNLTEKENVSLLQIQGENLRMFPDMTFDTVFSYAVLQHVYQKSTVLNYLDETIRVLKPGGIAKIQMIGSNYISGWRMRWVRASQTNRSRTIRLIAQFLPPDALIPWPGYYSSGEGLAGEGISTKEILAYVTGRVSEVSIEDFEDESLSSRYWLLLRK